MGCAWPPNWFRFCSEPSEWSARPAARVATPRVKPQAEAVRPMPTAPLTAVVHDAVRRWFQEAHKEAQRGDVVSPPLLALHGILR